MTDAADVLILGGSFLGVELVRALRRSRRGRGLEIVVVDRQTVHPYIPLGHELLCERMGTGAGTVLETARYVEERPPARWVAGEIVGFDVRRHEVELADGRRIAGRFVVVALGSDVVAPPGLPGGERLLAYKSAEQFERCRGVLGEVLEGGDGDGATMLVVGGGISGVEIAGELAHLRRRRPAGWGVPKVVMVHAGEQLLPGLTPRAGRRAAQLLRRQGVELHLGTRVDGIAAGRAVISGSGGVREIECALGFWGGGLQPPGVVGALGLPLTEDGWLRVSPTLQCVGVDEPEIFAGGDVARVVGGTGRWPTMQRAIEAIFAAHTIAENILRLAERPAGYAAGVPPLRPHRLWTDFPHGVSVGGGSLIVYGPLVLPLAGFSIWFRRFLMRRYMARYQTKTPD